MGTGMSVHAEEQTFTRINSIEELNDGDRFIVVNEKYKAVLTEWNKNKRFNYDSIKIENGIATTNSFVTIFTLEKPSPKYYHLKTEANLYLSNASSSLTNYCNLKTTPDVTSRATIEINKTYASIIFKNSVSKALLFSNGAGFSCYGDNFVGVTDKMIAIYKAEGSQSAIKQSTSVTFSSKDLTIYKGKEYSLPTASVTLQNGETIADAKLSYSSSNGKVASVNESTGEIITLNEFGTTTITAKYAGSDSYNESEGSYTLTYQDRLTEATIVFSAENDAFYNMPRNSDSHALPQDCIFKSDNGEEYKFKIYCFYKHRVNNGYLTSISGGAYVSSPKFFAPNGYAVRVIFEQKHNVSRPYISNADQTNYIKNGEGGLTGFNEYEFTETISDSKPFTISCTSICYIKKIEIFINPVPSLEIFDTDFDADAKIKEYDKTAVHFKLKRSFVADDTWYTICLPFNVAQKQLVEVFGGEKVELRTFDHMDGMVMYFKPVDDLAAGVPYLIKPNKNLDNLLFENVKIDMAAHPDLQVGADGYFMKGTYQATELNPDGTNLFLGDNNTFFRPSENDHRMKGTRVYFIIPRKAVGKVLSYDTETIVDGIVDVEVNSQSNSQKVYNINGVHVGSSLQNLTPGVYIVSGKKVVVTNR
ncbi:MAG: Ig-like domain-containing protein [Prevotella sp.]|nr:Ig-like domain-containing protein [Prevotella sp.]MDY4804290.1 Ig-like domain-containing protein [Prevotella sp.]